MNQINAYWKLLRPKQYVKNTFLFLPLFFAQRFFETELLLLNSLGFICFCMVASSIYIFNDYKDIDQDRNHPVKRERPLASGQITPSTALPLLGVLCGLGLLGAFLLNQMFFLILLGYFVMNLAYSIKLKHIPILDVFIISIGFILRVFAGAKISEVPASMWIILMTFLLALFMALAKRRDDVLLAHQGAQTRKSIDGYNLEFINAAMMLMAPVILVSYISYTISDEVMERFNSHYLYLTVLLVILGILRYLQVTFVENNSSNPTELLLKDRFLQLTLLAWVAAFMVLIY